MSSFGDTLRNAREAKGLTCSQVAAQTHMLVQIVEEMEREDFHRIPAPIYGRGFVRLFADCVGLDPLPLVREFMDIYEGRRAPTVSIREVPEDTVPPPVQPMWQQTPAPVPEPTPEPEPEPAPEPTPEPQQEVRGLDLFEQAQMRPVTDNQPLFAPPPASGQPARSESTADMPPPIDFDASPYLTSSDYGEGGPSATDRFRKSLSAVSSGVLEKVRNIPRRAWRMTALILCAILVILFIVWSVSKLYQATSTPPTPVPVAVPAEPSPAAEKQLPAKKQVVPAPNKPKAKAAQSPAKSGKLISTGQNIPNLFID